MASCYKSASRSQCDGTERARLEMNERQPATQHNYTEIGFKKMTLPDIAFKPLVEFFEANKKQEKPEAWQPGNTYVNHWDSPTYMVSFEDRSLRGGYDLKGHLWKHVQPIIEEWTGKKLKPTSLYGIRVYKRGAILATHVDRLPLVSSCIIQVAQDIDEPWPVEVYSHDGKAYNVTMKPGEMTLYESHTVLHGRPFPLNGTMYANVFVHYIPLDHDDMNAKDAQTVQQTAELARQKAAAEREAQGGSLGKLLGKMMGGSASNNKNDIGGHEQENLDPDEVAKHVAAAEKEEQAKHAKAQQQNLEEEEPEAEQTLDEPEKDEDNNEDHDDEITPGTPIEDGNRTPLHVAAGLAKFEKVKKLFAEGSGYDMLNVKDENGWEPIHEATRSGHLDMIRYLVGKGASLRSKTTQGGTPLWWARRLDVDPEIVDYFESVGAPEEGEDL